MAQVLTFLEYTPVARYDGDPWTEAQVQESSAPTGPWATIETITLDPVDADPENPQERNLTTDQASDTMGLWYRILFADADGDVSQPTFPFQNATLAPGQRDLCTLDQVLGYVPAYRADDIRTNEKLQQLITAESAQFQGDCGRELAPADSDPATRSFDVDRTVAWTRRLEIGDLSTIDDVTVTVLNPDGTVAEVVEASAVVPLYEDARDPTDEWEPVTALSFPAYLTDTPSLRSGQTVEVEGVWGFPSIPPHASEGCAAGVVLRALADIAETGTDFAEAAQNVSFQGLSDRRADAIQALSRFVAA